MRVINEKIRESVNNATPRAQLMENVVRDHRADIISTLGIVLRVVGYNSRMKAAIKLYGAHTRNNKKTTRMPNKTERVYAFTRVTVSRKNREMSESQPRIQV